MRKFRNENRLSDEAIKRSDVLFRIGKPDGKNVDKDFKERLKKWMKAYDLDVISGSTILFLYASEFEELREKAVRDLNLNKN